MKQLITLFITFVLAYSTYGQSYLQEGNHCFNEGDYTCAVANYNKVFINATGRDKQIAEIKLTRAKWCADHLSTANIEFEAKSYTIAKEEYQKVLDSNSKDSYVQSQITKCDSIINPPKLRNATNADIQDIWRGKYGNSPQRQQNLINAGINPYNAQTRISAGEGKPQKKEKKETSLSVSKKSLYFNSLSEYNVQVKIYTNANSYKVRYIPSWCNIEQFNSYIIVSASANPNYTVRKDWFKVMAGGKEVRINIVQYAKTGSSSSSTSDTESCFNCPKTNDTWGVTFSYAQQKIDLKPMDVYTIGLKIEPLFDNGFGINTGVNLLGYMNSLPDTQTTAGGFYAFAINIPLHLEYRLNFSKWFNIFAYGGVGVSVLTNYNFDNYTIPATFEYGGGLRISHMQFNIGRSLYSGNFKKEFYIENKEIYQEFVFSVSYMF